MVGGSYDFYGKVAVDAASSPILLFRKTFAGGLVLYPLVENYSWDHLRDLHSFVDAPLPDNDRPFRDHKTPMSLSGHVHVPALPKNGDRTVDYWHFLEIVSS